MHAKLRTTLAVIIASSALLMLGTLLLPWTVWDSGYGTVTVYGWNAVGPTTLLLGLVALALAVPIARSSPRVGWPIGAMCLFVVALFLSGYHIATVPSSAPGRGAFSAGFGVWLCLAASIIGAAAGLSVWRSLSDRGVSLATPPDA